VQSRKAQPDERGESMTTPLDRPHVEGGVVLRSSNVEVVVVPREGGRIASLRSVQSGLEFLTQARVDRTPVKPSLKNTFQSGPCAGAEECLPTVGPCEDRFGGPVPDHGDFWQLPWQLDSWDSQQLHMHALGFSRLFDSIGVSEPRTLRSISITA